MTNRDGTLEIGQHVTALMEKLEADPTMTDEFLAGDGALLITRAGVTYTGFKDRPDPDFKPSPMNADAAAGLHFAEVKQAAVDLLMAIEADPVKRREWLAGRLSVIADVEHARAVDHGPRSTTKR